MDDNGFNRIVNIENQYLQPCDKTLFLPQMQLFIN